MSDNETPDQGAEQPEVEETVKNPYSDVEGVDRAGNPMGVNHDGIIEGAPETPVIPEQREDTPVVPEEPVVEVEPFREAVAPTEAEQPALSVVTDEVADEPKAGGTRTFFGREYQQDENGALRQTSRK